MTKIEFTARLETVEQGGVYFTLPRQESEKFGTRGRVPVKGTLNGYPFRSSIFPTGDGGHFMGVNKEVRDGAKVNAGERVRLVMETDAAPRTVTLPPDLDQALGKSTHTRASFDKLSYTHRKEYVQWVEAAKRPETRARRIAQVLARLSAEMD
ncbi:MAG: hypothetical protein QOD00_2435 [Blastocatellia bacterium]|jgi:hypothetical protein|nr:hypothetical protein [Blastocatellia bacterium]